MFRFLRIWRERIKTCGLSFETPLLFSSFSPLFLKRRTLLPHPAIRRFLLRTSVRANGHAPAHRALSEFAIPAFTLHLHPQPVDTVCFAREGMCFFLPSPVKERGVKSSPASRWCIVFYGLMVKRWRQKTKNAGRARIRACVGGAFRVFERWV